MTHAQAGSGARRGESGARRVKASAARAAGRAEAAHNIIISELAYINGGSASLFPLLSLLAGLNLLELVRCSISIHNTSYKLSVFNICRSLAYKRLAWLIR